MAIAQEDRHPLVEILQQTPEIPSACQWAIFLRNHDELTLEMVTSKERDYMYGTYAADPRARINLGIRRRLAPLMDNDIDRIKLMNSLLLSMRGSPIVYYGDEIGMGDNIFIGDRNGVRTPMQWSPDRNAGFSRADPQRLYLPPIMDAIYGYEAVNVESQLRDPSSLLHWMRRMLAVRGTSRAFGRGELLFLKPGNRKVLAYLRTFQAEGQEEEVILCVANMARSAQPAELDLSAFRGRVPVELLGRTAFPPIGELPYMLTLPKHGFYWFQLSTDAVEPSWHQPLLPAEDRPVLVLFDGWSSIFRDQVVPWRIGLAVKTRAQFETDTLPRHIEQQRWYAAKGTPVQRARLVDHALWDDSERDAFGKKDGWLLPLLELDGPPGTSTEAATYFTPLSLAWEDDNQDGDEERYRTLGTAAIARIRQQAAVGVMSDAFADERFCRAIVSAMGERRELRTAGGTLRFMPTSAYAELAGPDLYKVPVSRPLAQSSNTIVTFGERLFLKGYRRVRPGVNPEFEVGRFLTEVAHFPHCVPVAGVLEYRGTDGGVMTLALLQGYVSNQGDGWAYTLAYLQRAFDLHRTGTDAGDNVHGAYLALAETLGRRTGGLHLAFATTAEDPAFAPEPLTAADVAAWRERATQEARQTFALLDAALPRLEGDTLAAAQAVLAAQRPLLDLIAHHSAVPAGRALKTRIHGDYHLGQVLLTRNDFVIIDFEGEPGRSFDERRARQSPLRDVAGMLRSFSYARAGGLRGIAATPDEQAQLVPFADGWEAEARAAFLRGYATAVQGSMLYGSFESQRGLLTLFELEKAFYELRYELNNRPDWVGIPLAGILSLIPR
jgi:maltose alpha-D-glucosyltransferase/alpha-amylase